MVKIIIWLVASILSGILYRLGGKGGFPNAKLIRRLGCSLVTILTMLLLGLYGKSLAKNIVLYFGTFVLLFGTLTTYHDYLAEDKSSEDWPCWAMTGLCYGLSAIPLAWAGVHWFAIFIRAFVLGFLTMAWSEKISNATWEERGRGFLIPFTLPILLI